MSGREDDTDGTDSYHPQHPWEQCGNPLYLDAAKRTKSNWPPVHDAEAAGPSESLKWQRLPD